MVPGQNEKVVAAILGTGVTNGATVTTSIDRLGFDYATIDVVMGTSNNSTNNPSVLKLSESDTTDATNYSDVTAFVGDGAGGFTIPTMSTANVNIVRMNVDCRARKRYLKVTASPVTTQAIVTVAKLARAKEAPDSATDAGVNAIVNG